MARKGNPWFRAYTEMVDDEKLRLLAFEDRWHFVALLCCKGAGLLDARDTPEMMRRKLALKLGLSPRELEEVGRRLSEVGLIDSNNFQPLAWDERQFKSDSSTERVRAYRDRMEQGRNVSVTAQDTDTEEDQLQSSTAAPSTFGPKGGWQDESDHCPAVVAGRAARIAQVSRDAVETFNKSKLTKANGGMVPNVASDIGIEKRQRQVAKCLKVARDICIKDFESDVIDREFWVEYWELCHEDEHKSGRAGGGKNHGNWVPTFEYLTREATMLEIYDRAVSTAISGGAR